MVAPAIFPQSLSSGDAIIQPADASNLKTLCTGKAVGSGFAGGSRVVDIQITSDETANARVIQFWANNGVADRLIGSINVPVNSGFNGSAPTIYPLRSTVFGYQTSGLGLGLQQDVNGNMFIELQAGEILKVKSITTLAAGKTITVRASLHNY